MLKDGGVRQAVNHLHSSQKQMADTSDFEKSNLESSGISNSYKQLRDLNKNLQNLMLWLKNCASCWVAIFVIQVSRNLLKMLFPSQFQLRFTQFTQVCRIQTMSKSVLN